MKDKGTISTGNNGESSRSLVPEKRGWLRTLSWLRHIIIDSAMRINRSMADTGR